MRRLDITTKLLDTTYDAMHLDMIQVSHLRKWAALYLDGCHEKYVTLAIMQSPETTMQTIVSEGARNGKNRVVMGPLHILTRICHVEKRCSFPAKLTCRSNLIKEEEANHSLRCIGPTPMLNGHPAREDS